MIKANIIISQVSLREAETQLSTLIERACHGGLDRIPDQMNPPDTPPDGAFAPSALFSCFRVGSTYDQGPYRRSLAINNKKIWHCIPGLTY
jgi:hypothetical protein